MFLMTKLSPEKVEQRLIEALKKKREALGISYGKLAEETNLHRTALSLIERGERHPTLLTCLKIADALDVDLSKILAD